MKGNKCFRSRIRNGWTVLTLAVVFALLVSGCDAKSPKVYRVGILAGPEAFIAIADGFKAGMAELGYIEGKNIVYDMQQPNPDPAEWRRVADRFVADEVDLIFAFSTEPAVEAKAATQGTNIPVIFAMSGVEGSGLVDNIRQPGGNITGVRYPGPENTGKRLEFMLALVPQPKRILITYDPTYPTIPSALEMLRLEASSAGVTLVDEPVASLAELQANLQARAALDDIGIDAILIMPEVLTQTPEGFRLLVAFANEHGVPIGGSLGYTADLGAVFSYAPDNNEMGKLAASLADKVFRGISAGTTPVITPEEYLCINYRVAQQLGLTVPQSLLEQAATVIR